MFFHCSYIKQISDCIKQFQILLKYFFNTVLCLTKLNQELIPPTNILLFKYVERRQKCMHLCPPGILKQDMYISIYSI